MIGGRWVVPTQIAAVVTRRSSPVQAALGRCRINRPQHSMLPVPVAHEAKPGQSWVRIGRKTARWVVVMTSRMIVIAHRGMDTSGQLRSRRKAASAWAPRLKAAGRALV